MHKNYIKAKNAHRIKSTNRQYQTENVKSSIAWRKRLHQEKHTLLPKFHSKRLAYPIPLTENVKRCKWLHQEKHTLLPKFHSKRSAYPNPLTENLKSSKARYKWLYQEKRTLLPKLGPTKISFKQISIP